MSYLRQQRNDLVLNIITKDAPSYGLLTSEPFVTHISSNFPQFPNQFLAALYAKMEEFDEYHVDVMADDPVHGPKFKEFQAVYAYCYTVLQQYQQQQYQQQLLVIQQQQQLQQSQYQNQSQNYQSQQYSGYGQNQNQFGGHHKNYQNNQYQNQQNQSNSYQSNFNQQGNFNQHQGNFNQHQGNFNQQGNNFNQHQGNNFNQHQGNNFNQNQGGYSNQGGYHKQNYRQHNQNQQQGQPQTYNQGQRYQNQQNRQKPYKNYQQDYQQGQNYQSHRNQNHHSGGHYPKYQQQPQYEPETQEPQVQPPQVVAPPPPPPKAEPKPMKFSLKQIKEFISEWNDKDKEIVNKELIEKVHEVNGWTKGEASFEEKPEKPQHEKKNYNNDNRNNRNNNRDQRGDNQQQQGFNTGSKFNKQAEAMPELVKKPTGLTIVVGKNETLEARMIKQEIRGKAGQDFATMMEKENETLDNNAKSKKEIIYNLNLLAPENLKEIQKDLTQYLHENEEVCRILIEQIIEKAWGQPKYASTYAKLCSEFSKVPVEKFTFTGSKEKKKDNPFKLYLISKVQHSFDKKVEEIPEFGNDEEKEAWLKETKKKILGNVKFIAELILSKVLKKKIMKICISQLIFTFLSKYYFYRKTEKIVDSYYDYYFEALIEFIENVGEFYEKMDESGDKKDDKKEDKNQTQPYEPAQRKIIDLIEMNQKPPEEQIEQITNLKAEDYFRLFSIIDDRILRKKNTRLSALLLNLTERRSNNWQKHHAESQGPKKLKDIKEDIAKEQEEMNKVKQQKRASMDHLNEMIKNMLKEWDKGERNQKTHCKSILKEYDSNQFYAACLNLFADEKKDIVTKRLELFDVILENYFDFEKIKLGFFESIKYMAFNSGDYPFAASMIAIVLKKILAKDGSKLKEFYFKTEDEDEEWFLNEVFGRLWHYTKNDDIKEFTEPNKKYTNMLEV